MSVARVLSAGFFVGAVALGVASDFAAPGSQAGVSGSANPGGFEGHCMPQDEGDYSPGLMDRLAGESGWRVIPLPQGSIARVPADCALPALPEGVPASAWNAMWNCEYVPVDEYTGAAVRAMVANGFIHTQDTRAGELDPPGC